MGQTPQRLGEGVFAVDTLHVRREADASYLIVDGARAAFVDTGTQRSVPNLLAALGALGISLEQVEYVLLTHVHLDHAGGAGALMAAGVYLHLTEHHEHEHAHEPMTHSHLHVHDEHHRHAHELGDPPGEPHTHVHRHAPLRHSHPHVPDMHHTHRH